MPEPAKGNKRDTSDDVKAKAKVTPAMKKEAEAQQAKALEEAKQEKETSGLGVLRKKGGSAATGERQELIESDIPYPAHVHGKDFEFYGPHGYAAEVPEGVDIAPYSADQEFVINPDLVRNIMFAQPGKNLPKKRLYNVKGLHRDGRFNQFAFEGQINNTAGGDPADAIGLRRYERKGIHMFIDWNTLIPLFCGAWNCWAKAAQSGEFTGFCSMRHAQHTLPNRYKGGGGAEAQLSAMGRDVTTTAVWAG